MKNKIMPKSVLFWKN